MSCGPHNRYSGFTLNGSIGIPFNQDRGREHPRPEIGAVHRRAYVFTVACLVLPYLVFSNYVASLVFTLVAAILIIVVFNFYISVAKDLPFRRGS